MNVGPVIGQTFKDSDLLQPRTTGQPGWYALHTRSRCEKVVDRLLSERGFETFLPLATKRSRVSFTRFREAQIPLFPGYTFARFDPSNQDYYQVRATSGVARILGDRAGPVSIPDTEIESLRRVLEYHIGCSVSPGFAAGQQVVVAAGPLAGIHGEIVRRKNGQRFVVKIQLIRRMLEVDFCPADLKVAAEAAGPRHVG